VPSGRTATALLTAATAVALVWLASGLPAGAFFSGDSGVKLIATLDAIGHPSRPFEADLPRIGDRTNTFVDPMVLPHGGHAHVLQSPLFPPLTAPLVAAFGLRGAYIWPAVAFVALVPLCAATRRQLLPDTSWPLLAWIVVVANPLIFYALEFWEHAPAVALLAAGTTVLAPSLDGSGSRARVALGGALVGGGILLRPEGAWYAVGLGLVLGPRRWLPFGGGAAALLLPGAAANYVHFGNPLGAHASAVLSPVGDEFLGARFERTLDWLVLDSTLGGVGLLLVFAAGFAGRFAVDIRARQLLSLAGVAIVAVVAAQRGLQTEAMVQGFPLALLVLMPASTASANAVRLGVAAMVAVVGIVLTAPNDGGAQWGARYLLIAAPPLLLLAGRGATEAIGNGRWRAPRIVLLAVVLLAGAMTSRAAYQELRGTKRNYEGLVMAVSAAVPPGGVIVTNAWWLDQIAAALHGTRTFLYVQDEAAAARAFEEVRSGGLEVVTLAWSEEDSPFRLEAALDRTCFRVGAVREIPLRAMRLASARCDNVR
jgi:hypothetical protein